MHSAYMVGQSSFRAVEGLDPYLHGSHLGHHCMEQDFGRQDIQSYSVVSECEGYIAKRMDSVS